MIIRTHRIDGEHRDLPSIAGASARPARRTMPSIMPSIATMSGM